jgi:hypothetical protein
LIDPVILNVPVYLDTYGQQQRKNDPKAGITEFRLIHYPNIPSKNTFPAGVNTR